MYLYIANIIRLLHIGIILFILLIPFYDIPGYLLLHIVSCISLLIHWNMNSDICFLTLVENYIRNIPYHDTLIYQIVSPLYNIEEYKLNKIIWLLTTTLLFISINKFINSEKVNNIINKYYIIKPIDNNKKIYILYETILNNFF